MTLPLRLLLLLALLVPLLPDTAQAKTEDLEEVDKLPAVQNRLYRNEHEFDFAGIGVLPVDPYVKGVVLTGGYGWHITDIWAVEAHFNYLFNVKTSLRDKLENNFGIPTTRFTELNWYVDVGTLFKPIYGKLSFLNSSLVYGEFFLSFAAIVAHLDGGTKTEERPEGRGPRLGFGAAPGFGIRGYLHPRVSARLDFRWMLIYSDGEGHYPLALTLTFGATTRSDL